MFNLKLYTIKERRPKNKEVIILFGIGYASGMRHTDLEPEEVEYSWIVLDDDGTDSGDQIVFDTFKNKPKEPCRLLLLRSMGRELHENDVYARWSDMEKIYDKIEKL